MIPMLYVRPSCCGKPVRALKFQPVHEYKSSSITAVVLAVPPKHEGARPCMICGVVSYNAISSTAEQKLYSERVTMSFDFFAAAPVVCQAWYIRLDCCTGTRFYRYKKLVRPRGSCCIGKLFPTQFLFFTHFELKFCMDLPCSTTERFKGGRFLFSWQEHMVASRNIRITFSPKSEGGK